MNEAYKHEIINTSTIVGDIRYKLDIWDYWEPLYIHVINDIPTTMRSSLRVSIK
jgi:hypothetical protein